MSRAARQRRRQWIILGSPRPVTVHTFLKQIAFHSTTTAAAAANILAFDQIGHDVRSI